MFIRGEAEVGGGVGGKVSHASHSDNLRFNCLLSGPASFLAALHNEEYECLRGESGHRDFPVCGQHGCLLLLTMVNVIGYFFVLFSFFTCTVHKKIKYKAIPLVASDHFVISLKDSGNSLCVNS